MRVFNSIQIVALLMASPTLLSLCKTATFVGAGAIFWVGLLATVAAFVFTVATVVEGLEK